MKAPIWHSDHLHVLFGLPGAGKTSVALDWAMEHARLGGFVVWHELCGDEGRVNKSAEKLGVLWPKSFEVRVSHARDIGELNLGYPSPGSLVVLDYFQMVAPGRTPNRAVMTLAAWARVQAVAVLVLSLIELPLPPEGPKKQVLATRLGTASKSAWLVSNGGVIEVLK